MRFFGFNKERIGKTDGKGLTGRLLEAFYSTQFYSPLIDAIAWHLKGIDEC